MKIGEGFKTYKTLHFLNNSGAGALNQTNCREIKNQFTFN